MYRRAYKLRRVVSWSRFYVKTGDMKTDTNKDNEYKRAKTFLRNTARACLCAPTYERVGVPANERAVCGRRKSMKDCSGVLR